MIDVSGKELLTQWGHWAASVGHGLGYSISTNSPGPEFKKEFFAIGMKVKYFDDLMMWIESIVSKMPDYLRGLVINHYVNDIDAPPEKLDIAITVVDDAYEEYEYLVWQDSDKKKQTIC